MNKVYRVVQPDVNNPQALDVVDHRTGEYHCMANPNQFEVDDLFLEDDLEFIECNYIDEDGNLNTGLFASLKEIEEQF